MNIMRKHIIFIAIALMAITGCNEKVEKSLDLSGNLVPAQIVSPSDTLIDIDEYVPVPFKWSGASWDGIGVMTFDMAFDRPEGDFSRPIAVFHAPGPADSRRVLSKDEIKSVFAAATSSKESEISVQWIVRTAAGAQKINSAPATVRLAMTPEPDAFVPGNTIYIAGTGSVEKGQHMTYIPSIDYDFAADHYNDNSNLKNFNYEIFTELEAGKPYYFWSGTTTGDKDWYFTVDPSNPEGYSTVSKSIKKEADTTAAVSVSGIYRIRMNTSSGEIYIKRISSVSLRYWNGAVNDNTMTYEGSGTWSVRLNVAQGAFGYKFLFFGLDGDQPTGSEYPSLEYSSDPMDKYWHIVTVKGGAATAADPRAAGTWGFPETAMDRESLYTIYMNDIYGSYTHYIE